MPAHRSIFVLAGMLVPVAYAQAPQSAPPAERAPMRESTASFTAGQFNHAGVRSTAAALRGEQASEMIMPIYATQAPR